MAVCMDVPGLLGRDGGGASDQDGLSTLLDIGTGRDRTYAEYWHVFFCISANGNDCARSRNLYYVHSNQS